MAEQRRLAASVRHAPMMAEVRLVAGIDAGFPRHRSVTRAAVVAMTYPDLAVAERAVAKVPTTMPYIPGLLSFRELPAILEALAQLTAEPDLFLCDGQGIAHPRRVGIATHLGVLLDTPSIGVAKSRLIGTYDEVGAERGDWQPLMDGIERIGTVLRTRQGVKPVFVSPGHCCDHDDAVNWTMRCLSRYRLPEPIRAADRFASNR
ncbi:deoxyribonuclease V [Spiribacter sp. 221]|uniref:deoxyribonuclease V n=1 Tax=Spiribacter onubensis TaxID=3122420 RepID=UPI00349F439E